MATLVNFRNFLDQRYEVLEQTEERLCKLQEKYEMFFSEVAKTRESEFSQLKAHIMEKRGSLPQNLDQELDQAVKNQKEALLSKLEQLQQQRDELLEQAEQVRKDSSEDEYKVKKKNCAQILTVKYYWF